MKDYEIIDLYWKRKEEAITMTAEKYGSYCHSISYNILHNNEDAEECVNDTWLGAWKSIPPKHPKCLPAYLGKITRNLSLNRFKQKNTQKRGLGQAELVLSELEDCIPGTTGIEQIMEEKFLIKSINDFLYAQPERKRNIFIRRYWYVFSVGDIAKIYKMKENNVASILYRMRNDLKSHLEKEGIVV